MKAMIDESGYALVVGTRAWPRHLHAYGGDFAAQRLDSIRHLI
jgi:hypothetical protein